jgi:hypothetical protein
VQPVKLKFNTPEEQSAFIKLFDLIPRTQTWNDVKGYRSSNNCHICNGTNYVKSGIVSFNELGSPDKSNSYTFWNYCLSCHDHGWRSPPHVSRIEKIRYYRTGVLQNNDEHVIDDFKMFKFPLIQPLGTDTVIIAV